MKIIGIDDSLSTPTSVAIITEPPIDEGIYAEIQKMTRDDLRSPLEPPTPLLTSLRLQNNNGRLIINIQHIDDNIASNIQCLLDEAEKRSKNNKQIREENAGKEIKAHQDQKQELIKSAISAFGIPRK